MERKAQNNRKKQDAARKQRIKTEAKEIEKALNKAPYRRPRNNRPPQGRGNKRFKVRYHKLQNEFANRNAAGTGFGQYTANKVTVGKMFDPKARNKYLEAVCHPEYV